MSERNYEKVNNWKGEYYEDNYIVNSFMLVICAFSDLKKNGNEILQASS